MVSLPRIRLVILTYSVCQIMPFQFARFLVNPTAALEITNIFLLILWLTSPFCLFVGIQLIWGLFIRLNGLQILFLNNFLLRYSLNRVNGLWLWLIIFNLPKILPILTKILRSLEEIDNLLGDKMLLKLQKWLHHLHSAYLICARKSHIGTKLHLIYFI